MYSRDINGILLKDGEVCERVIVDEDLLLRMFRWLRRGGKVNLGVKSPWWAKYVESDYPEEFNFDLPTNTEITIYWLLMESIKELGEHDKKIIFERVGTGKRINYRQCSQKFNVSHERFRQQLQSVILMVQKTFDKGAKKAL